jgi:hypothetical protein
MKSIALGFQSMTNMATKLMLRLLSMCESYLESSMYWNVCVYWRRTFVFIHLNKCRQRNKKKSVMIWPMSNSSSCNCTKKSFRGSCEIAWVGRE